MAEVSIPSIREDYGTGSPKPGKPWRRLWARGLDGTLANVVLMPIWGPALFVLIEHELLRIGAMGSPPALKFFVVILLFVLAFREISTILEAAVLSRFQTTPGKRWLGVVVRARSGEPLTFRLALRRELMVRARGFALELPWLSLIAMWRARASIKRGAARWDSRLGLAVSYEPISRFRLWSFPASLFLLYTTTVAWGLYHHQTPGTSSVPASFSK